jgi:hypothetical protein
MQDSATPYTAFVRRNNPNVAVELFSTRGVLYYDEGSKSYIVSTLRRVADPEAPDNWLELNTQNCTVTGYGQMSLGTKMGRVQMAAYGQIEHRLRSGRMNAKMSSLNRLKRPFQPRAAGLRIPPTTCLPRPCAATSTPRTSSATMNPV